MRELQGWGLSCRSYARSQSRIYTSSIYNYMMPAKRLPLSSWHFSVLHLLGCLPRCSQFSETFLVTKIPTTQVPDLTASSATPMPNMRLGAYMCFGQIDCEDTKGSRKDNVLIILLYFSMFSGRHHEERWDR